ncbi:SIR2 family NAD-dependent protein deacylase [Aequorivita vladivostokensis]|jgi:NAD-dependent deacetylase|uniref:NAD-dependent protein deacylase n=1 Tax=Aequorivita vladivostokensis TaxID=171194 RepID=A0ABR5DJY9_9FLAO|nr:NAD-dependent deacetylase [Aequorivita vladivostokensis]|tara:strand:+ start:69910 stop:70581 length:672 start_codon:yes stop_codon:yes gene_type:complete
MKIAVLTGAGVSAESGIKTFRDSDGLWEGHDVMEVASPEGFERNPKVVLDFYNQRRKQLLTVKPNAAHFALADLEKNHDVTIITQNVDDLHERAGSTNLIHLHGELLKVRSTFDEDLILDWKEDLNLGDFCENNHQLRPHIVWFGEMVPMIEVAADVVARADAVIIVGTSMQVYPAAGLVQYAKPDAHIYFVDPKPSISESKRITVFAEKASIGVPKVVELLK